MFGKSFKNVGLGYKSRFFLLFPLPLIDLSIYGQGRRDVCKEVGSWAIVRMHGDRKVDAAAECALQKTELCPPSLCQAHPDSWSLLPCWWWAQFPSWVLHMVKRFCFSCRTKFKGRGDLHQMVAKPRKGCCGTALGALCCDTNYLSFFVTVKLSCPLFLSPSCI